MQIDGVPFDKWIDINHSNSRWPDKVGSCWISDECINWLVEVMGDLWRKTYLEIGTFDGIAISLLAEKYPEKHFIAVDAFKTGENTAGGHMGYFIENNKHLDNVQLFIGESRDLLPKLWNKVFPDVIFIDADHSYEAVVRDMTLACMLAKPWTIVAMHDYGGMDGVTKAIDKFCASNGFELKKAADIVYIVKGEK